MKNKGLAQYRFKTNPWEKKFAEQWEMINTTPDGILDGKRTLDYLLAKEPNRPNGEVTKRDREVAATVIQWLGSPCGYSFLETVFDEDYKPAKFKRKKAK